MTNYLPSLEERRKKLIGDCCGGSGMGGDVSAGPSEGEVPTADSDGNSLINRTLKNLKSKRKARKAYGT